MKEKRTARILVSLLFVILLIVTYILSRSGLSPSVESDGKDKNLALNEYGFYFSPANEKTGITFRHLSPDLDPKLDNIKLQIASVGASVSICDFDNDGWNDIYFTNSQTGSLNALYRNLHDGNFEDVAATMGVADINVKGTGTSMGSVWGDFNNDGYKDLLVYKWGKPELFRNIAGKHFERITEQSNLPAWVNSNSAIWFDFDKDGLLDIFIAGYYQDNIHLDNLNTTAIMPESFKYANNGGHNYLLKNMGNGTFKDISQAYGFVSTKWTLAVAAADFNGDMYPDLYLANDYNVDELYINESGKQFVESGNKAGVGKVPKSGMSATLGDINNEGTIGIFTTSITEKGVLIQGNDYWRLKETKGESPSFVNLAQLAGIDNAGWSYGAQFGDFNNDGFMDLYVANGFISAEKNTSYWYEYSKVTGGNSKIIGDARNWPDMKGRSQSGFEVDKIWINNGDGTFTDASGKVCPDATYDGRAVAVADLWNRGILDVVVANQNNIPLIYKNELKGANHWISFDLKGKTSNSDAIGARVELKWENNTQTQIVTGGVGFASQNQHRLHFGIGKVNTVDQVTFYWPSGKIQKIAHPAIDKLHLITEN